MNWFSNYKGINWTPDKGYNELFLRQILCIRSTFSLKASAYGEDAGSTWMSFIPQKGDDNPREATKSRGSQLLVYKFTYGDVRRCTNDTRNKDGRDYLTPQFRLYFRMAREGKVYLENVMVIEFKPDFPLSPPRFRLDTPEYLMPQYKLIEKTDLDIEERKSLDIQERRLHHIYRDGWICIMRGGQEWKPDSGETIATALIRAIGLVEWHDQHFELKKGVWVERSL